MYSWLARWHRFRLSVATRLARWFNRRVANYKVAAIASTDSAVINAALPALRMGVCAKCPLLSKAGFCGSCHCFMPMKTRLPKAKCPLGKW